jgi:geranylgeranyl diphosphate synthase type I
MSGQAPVLEKNQAICTLVEQTLASFLGNKVAGEGDPGLKKAFTYLQDFTLRGGKRMRPLFCYWGWRSAAGPDPVDSEIIPVAAAVELFHVAALIHDDIVDQSDLRRGRSTMHRDLEQEHHDAQWQGDSGQFGLSAALLAGDASLVWSEELFHDSWRASRSPEAMSLFSRLRTDAVRGEYLDIFGEARGGSVSDALEVIRYKTARYTVRDPLELGASIAGAADSLIAVLRDFGLLIGEGYQLRDDLFGFFGDPSMTGKSNLDDIRQGKLTVLITVARELADRTQAERIEKLYGASWAGPAEVAELQEVVVSTGAREAIEQMISGRRQQALEVLEAARLGHTAREALRQLADAATDRAQ